jgi:hypothetical protein
MADQHHLLAFAQSLAAEIHALLQRHMGAFGAQPPAGAAGEAEEDGFAVLLEARVHAGVEVEADGVGETGLGVVPLDLDRILAAHVLAGFGEIQAPVMDGAEGFAPAVVAGFEPMRAIGLLSVQHDLLGAAAEAFGFEFGAGGVGDHQGGMRAIRWRRGAPRRN